MDEKPELRRYLKAQNDPFYKITGAVKAEDGRTFYEVNFARNKCIIDAILISFIVAFFIAVFALGIIQDKHYHDKTLVTIITLLVFPCLHIIVPFFVRLLRIIFGLRWYYTQFTDIEIGKNGDYLEFYNNFILQDIGILFKKEREKAKEIKDEYFKDNKNVKKKIFGAISVVFIILYIIFALTIIFLLILNVKSAGFALILFFAGFLFIYGLSHASAYFFWLRVGRKSTENS